MQEYDKLIEEIKSTYAKSGIKTVFTEFLGWDEANVPSRNFKFEDVDFAVQPIVTLSNFNLVRISCSKTPTPESLRLVQREISKISTEYLAIYEYGSTQKWRWPKRSSGGGSSFETLEVQGTNLPLYLVQRLAALKVSVNERRSLSIAKVRDMVAGQFDSSKVTKQFFDKFKKQHLQLSKSIKGLPTDEASSEYSSLLLNRLMFLYFFEKKGFLNNDLNYLRTCLTKLQELQGENKFYSFYKDILLPMCFLGLNSKERPLQNELSQIIGDVPYVNGGIFAEHDIEQQFDIEVPDAAFIAIFNLFDSYTWHLDTHALGKDNEINPDVLGYIFEQYINFTSSGKKEAGAYYTPADVSHYMAVQTVILRVLDFLVDSNVSALALLTQDPHRYIYKSQLHGFDLETLAWLEVPTDVQDLWESDPIHWNKLDKLSTIEEFCLPSESWVEAMHRRNRVDGIIGQIRTGSITEINDLLTLNLNSELLVLDAIESIDDLDTFNALWKKLERLSVLDPTCGSGAFLFAALELLESVYTTLIETVETKLKGSQNLETEQWLTQITNHPNRKYYVRKHIALNNLYGNDLMGEAIETAKLRIFLSLVACLHSRNELEPLPDLDFNLKVGNLVVGLSSSADVERIGGDLFTKSALDELKPKIENYEAEYRTFIDNSEKGLQQEKQRNKVQKLLTNLRKEVDSVMFHCYGENDPNATEWITNAKPMHWFIEFPHVMMNGGFDVIIGNPPYIKKSDLSESDLFLIASYKCAHTPDFYATCYERSFELLHKNGRHGFIVMLSLAFSDGYGPLRQLISDRRSSEWWTTYGKRPDSLFHGVQVRNTVLIVAPGSDKFSTCHQLFSAASRIHLFEQVHYYQMSRISASIPSRAGIANDILRQIQTTAHESRSAGDLVYRPTASYWFPVLPNRPPVVDYETLKQIDVHDSRVKTIKKTSAVTDDILLATLGGKLGYLAWSALEDDFDATEKTISALIYAFFPLDKNAIERLDLAAKEVKKSLNGFVFVVNNKGGYINIRWNAMREITDEFDKALLTELGLEHLWPELNIWYRQVMKATSENSNSKPLTESQVSKLLGW